MADGIKVLLPATFRRDTEDRDTVTLAGSSVGDVLQDLCARFPGLGGRLFRDGATLNRFVNVFVNDEDIRFLEELRTPVKDGDEVLILPALAGG